MLWMPGFISDQLNYNFLSWNLDFLKLKISQMMCSPRSSGQTITILPLVPNVLCLDCYNCLLTGFLSMYHFTSESVIVLKQKTDRVIPLLRFFSTVFKTYRILWNSLEASLSVLQRTPFDSSFPIHLLTEVSTLHNGICNRKRGLSNQILRTIKGEYQN